MSLNCPTSGLIHILLDLRLRVPIVIVIVHTIAEAIVIVDHGAINNVHYRNLSMNGAQLKLWLF